ncbi:hypothetical protein ABZ345_17790 [Lentzea sp. NPDC005914]|uniref:hypothetical protein n=1 Tax=Lentzea sp. NPDC005914 TaxID=3154572 RepID=UPI0033F0AF2A
MAIVSTEVAERLRSGTFAALAVFTASCAERMAQLFTGLRGDDAERAADIATFLAILDELWDADLPATGFLSRVGELEGFDELDRTADEEPLSEIDDIYSFNSVLCMRYAALYRATQDPEEAVCSREPVRALAVGPQHLTARALRIRARVSAACCTRRLHITVGDASD